MKAQMMAPTIAPVASINSECGIGSHLSSRPNAFSNERSTHRVAIHSMADLTQFNAYPHEQTP